MENKRYFFVIGMPRTRTAWMSALLSQGDSICLHEGTKGFATFAEYAAHLRSLPYAAVGDSNSTLVFNIKELLEEFPDADIWFINREAGEALESLVKTDPARESEIRGMWPAYCAAWDAAKEYCIDNVRPYQFGGWEMFKDVHFCRALYGSCTGEDIAAGKVQALQDLRITTLAEGPYVQPPAPAAPVALKTEGRLTLVRLRELGFDLDGITVRQYTPADYQMVSGWWKSHLGRELSPAEIPGLGVVVENEERPVAALFCCEVYGSLSARLEFPVTAPGTKLADAQRFLAVAVVACMQLAGRRIVPEPPQFQLFHVATPPAIARTLKRLGFVEDPRDKVNLCFNNQEESK